MQLLWPVNRNRLLVSFRTMRLNRINIIHKASRGGGRYRFLRRSIQPMTKVLFLTVAALNLPVSVITDAQGPPEFDQFPAWVSFSRESLLPNSRLTGHGMRKEFRFRETLTTTIRPNFAGAFTVVEISCGTGCTSMAVIDENTGSTFTRMPFFSLITGSQPPENYFGLKYHLDSRLLIGEGWFDSTAAPGRGYLSRNYYEWTGRSFHLLKKVSLPERKTGHP